MEENLGISIMSCAAVLIVCAICFTALSSCDKSLKSYDALASECIRSGGSFIPTNQWNAVCAKK